MLFPWWTNIEADGVTLHLCQNQHIVQGSQDIGKKSGKWTKQQCLQQLKPRLKGNFEDRGEERRETPWHVQHGNKHGALSSRPIINLLADLYYVKNKGMNKIDVPTNNLVQSTLEAWGSFSLLELWVQYRQHHVDNGMRIDWGEISISTMLEYIETIASWLHTHTSMYHSYIPRK